MTPAPNKYLKTTVLAAWCALLCTGAAAQDASPRDEAVGVNAGILGSTASPKEDPEMASDEYEFLDETLSYQMKKQRDWRLRVFGTVSWRYDSNVFLTDTNEQSDNVYSVRPGFQFSYGEEESTLQFTADYSSLFNFFQDNTSQDSVNHFLSTAMNIRANKTSVKLNLMMTQVTGGDLDVGGQAQRFQMIPSVVVQHELTDKVRIGLSGQLQESNYSSLLSSTTYRLGIYADYAFSPQLWLGLQFNQVFMDIEQSGRQSGQELLVRMDWEPFEKLHVKGNAGVNLLHTVSAGDFVLPSGLLSLSYQVGPKTSVHVSGYARASNSPSLAGQFFQSSGFTVGAEQKLGTKVVLGADLGYDFSDYHSYQAGTITTRRDHVLFMRPWLKYALSRRLSLEFFYQHTNNDSTGTGAQPFSRDLVGLGITGSW